MTRTSIRRVILASFVGTTIEWYDFFLYGTAAALVFNRLFFPTVDPLLGTLSSYGTFAVGFVARPLGGIIFGHYGDRVGRKAMLVYSLVLMGVATAAIGLVPTYASIGVWAPVLLILLRFAQGIGVGGEWGGAVLMAVEHSPGPRRGFHGSWPQMGVPAGSLLATGMFALVSSSMSDPQFLAWGWRIPFLLSTVLIAVGLFIRLRLLETPAFAKVKETRGEARIPLVDLFREHPREILVGMGMRIGQNATYYIYTVFVLSYGEKILHYPKTTKLSMEALVGFLGIFDIPVWGHQSDKIGRRPLALAGATFSMVWAFPFFWLLGQGSIALVILAMVLAMPIGHDIMYGPQAAYFSELFGTHVRYSGASLIYQLASVFSGGFAPLIATLLLAKYGPTAIAGYMALMCAISVVATWLAPETHRREIG
jgi:metabolite-proton symporter